MSLRAYRDLILKSAADPQPSRRRALLTRGLQSLGFVTAFRAALAASDVLVLQFVTGAVILYALESMIVRARGAGLTPSLPLPPELQKRDPFELALLEGVMSLEAARKRDFPIQQNALLALALIGLPPLLGSMTDTDPRWLVFLLPLGALDFVIRSWLEARDESTRWLGAVAALRRHADEARTSPLQNNA